MSPGLRRLAQRWASAWLWLLMAAPAVGLAQTGGGTLLADGGFDGPTVQPAACARVQGRLPLNWSDNSCWNPNAVVTYEPEAFTGRHDKALKISLMRGVFQLVQALNLPPQARLGAAVWVRASRPMVVKLSVRQAASPYVDYGARYLRVTDRWERLAVSAFTHGLGPSDARQALWMLSSATPGILWVDDAELTAQREALTYPTETVPRAFFGSHVLHERNLPVFADATRAGSVRIWDSAGAQWAFVQKSRPVGTRRTYQWRGLDERVSAARDAGQDVLMVLGGYAPAWASLDPDADASPPLGNHCFRCDERPRRPADWRNWVTDVVTRYQGKGIRFWEIWNEPAFNAGHDWCPDPDSCVSALGSGFRGSPEQLLQLQNDAADIVHRLDPQAKVVSAGVSYLHRGYLDYFLRIGGGRSADVIGYHLYLAGHPELLMPQVLAVKALMRDAGVGDKPLWSTESAIEQINPDLDPAVQAAQAAGRPAPSVDALGPAYLARFMLVSWASGLGRVYHYAWDGGHPWPSSTAVLSKSSNAILGLKDAGLAYNTVASWLVGKRLTGVDSGAQGGAWRLSLVDDKGRASHIVWHPAAAQPVPVNLTPGAVATTVCDLGGRCVAVKAGDPVMVSFSPVLAVP